MNISSGLKKIKLLRNELKRKITIRKDNFFVIIPKDSTLDKEQDYINFESITEEIGTLTKQISTLREKILKTNIKTNATIDDDKEVSLAMLKLMIDDFRSELAQFNSMKDDGLFSFDRRRRIRTTEEEEKQVPQLNDLELEERFKSLEENKVKLENLLEYMNTNTELVD